MVRTILLRYDIKTFNRLKAIKRTVSYRLDKSLTWEQFIKLTIMRIK